MSPPPPPSQGNQYVKVEKMVKTQNSNQYVKVQKMVVFAKSHKFNFGHFFSCPVKLWNNLKLKLTSRFNHGFTHHCYLHSAIWQGL